ncbi:MAG: hypothetical protein LLG01_10560 [Planctomycetaceae bacterium]|nr:hypothetical protein [Planctomycetaceae bacterium]
MNEAQQQPQDALESLLRKSGARQALQQAHAGQAPAMGQEIADMTQAQEPPSDQPPAPLPEVDEPIPVDPRKFGANTWLSRLIPLSVAAALAVVAGILLYNYRNTDAGKNKDIQALKARLVQADAANALARKSIGEQESAIQRLQGEKAQADEDLAKLKVELQNARLQGASDKTRATQLGEQVAQLRKDLDESQKLNAQRQAQAEELSANMAAMVREVDAKKDKNEKIREELQRTMAEYHQGIAQQNNAVRQYQALRQQYAALFESAQQAYLGVKGGQNESLDARQAALKRSNLLKRLTALRQQSMSEAGRRALETSEVLLTRLGMVNAAMPAEVQEFQSLLKRSGVADQIDAVLAGAVESEALRGWLFEAKMILG